jgi:hypothetical protein
MSGFFLLVALLQFSGCYRGKSLLETDHIANGFVSHGDHCAGCTHINFFAVGPDFKKNLISDTHRELIDILPAVGKIMGFTSSGFKRKVMWKLVKNYTSYKL